MEITTLEDHIRLMLGRLVMENVTLARQVEELRKQLALVAKEPVDGPAQ